MSNTRRPHRRECYAVLCRRGNTVQMALQSPVMGMAVTYLSCLGDDQAAIVRRSDAKILRHSPRLNQNDRWNFSAYAIPLMAPGSKTLCPMVGVVHGGPELLPTVHEKRPWVFICPERWPTKSSSQQSQPDSPKDGRTTTRVNLRSITIDAVEVGMELLSYVSQSLKDAHRRLVDRQKPAADKK